jgi:repressor LexA
MVSFTEESGYPPTVREICKATGLKSPRSASQHLQALERKGYIQRGKDKSRAIRFLDKRPGAIRPALPENVVMLPVMGKAAAGYPSIAPAAPETAYAVDRGLFNGGKTFLLKVKGKSMVNAHIMEGDLVVVDPEPETVDGDVVVAMIDNETTVKRYETRSDGIYLAPENHEMSPIDLSSQSRDISILGKVVGLIRKMS